MSKKREMPQKIQIGGVWHILSVFKIVSRNEDGTPWELELLQDHQATEIVGGEEYMTGFVRRHMLFPKESE